MEKAINYLIAHPVLFFIAIILAVMVLFSSLKKMFRLLLVAAAVLVLYAAYVYFTGGDVHASFSRFEQWLNEALRYIGSLGSYFADLFKSSKKQ
ncbi:MAG: hypothetical protein HGA70_00905 [Chlorobiaceae bacterium]|nr:hypothetical protein [Chlorobiaceae bacterium]NTW09810.1 hypothetical protein [Chlorobiaceae bacterium]